MKIIGKVISRLNRLKHEKSLYVPVSNVNKKSHKKRCLLVYLTSPFIFNDSTDSHQCLWQVKEIAKLLDKNGYIVDVADWKAKKMLLSKKYDLIIDIVPGKYPEIRKYMNPGCKTIAYFTTSNPSFQNAAEKKRLADLFKRKGINLTPRRQDTPYTKEIEKVDACFVIGNEHNWKTFENEFNLPKPYFIKNTGHKVEYGYNSNSKDKRSFLYFGSGGCVHKGLDLLLEVFSEDGFPCDLYVCGCFKFEEDFESCYYHELYECPNIHPIGFVSTEGEQFKAIVDKCVYAIMPSCSEGVAGSVLTTMSEGLINICSRECGLDDDEVIHLKDCSIETIRATVLEYAQKDDEWVKSKSKNSYDIIQERYSKENFIESLTFALDEVLKERD